MHLLAKTARLVGVVLAILSVASLARAAGIAKGPYLMNVTPRSVTVCWLSDAPADGVVRYDVAAAGATSDEPLRHTRRDGARRIVHRVTLKGLDPYVRYRYRVECAGDTGGGEFVTAAMGDQPFRFVAYGDNRSQPAVHAAVVARITRYRPDFVINTGDQVADGSSLPQWAVFFGTAEPMLRDTPYFPELGNHEGSASPYFSYFGPHRYYSFDYGNAHFVGVDTNLSGAALEAELKWLRRDLDRKQGKTWRVLYMHHPLYTCTTVPGRREGAAALRARLEPLVLKYHVQLVVAGHDHNYQRHEAHGVTYLISGGGGAPLYDLKADTPHVVKAVKAYEECEFRVEGTAMTCTVVTPDGETIDTFNLQAYAR